MPNFDLGFMPSQHRFKRFGFNGTSLQTFLAAFPDERACLDYLFKKRFGADPACPRCGKSGRWRRHSVQKHFFHPCGGILSPMAGTVFSRSRVDLQLWFYAMLFFADSAESIAAPFLERQIGVSGPSAFRMSQRIRMQMAAIGSGTPLASDGGIVTAELVKVRRITNEIRNRPNRAYLFLLSDSQRVDSTVMIKPSRKILHDVISKKVHRDAKVLTKCFQTSRILSNYKFEKYNETFSPEFFADNKDFLDRNHGFTQYFNLSFANQFRGVSRDNAWLYVKEYEFRYNRRHRSEETFWDLISEFPDFNDGSIARCKMLHSVTDS